MTVTIPDSYRDFVSAQVASGKYTDESALVCALLERERKSKERESIDQALLDALSGESTPMTSGDWDEIRAEVQRRHQARNGSRP